MATDFSFLGNNQGYGFGPELWQWMATAAQELGKNKGYGPAFGAATSQALRVRGMQNALASGQGQPTQQNVEVDENGNPIVQPRQTTGSKQFNVTGPEDPNNPNKVTQTITPKGTTYTIDMPNQQGQQLPVESLQSKLNANTGGGVSDQSPFWRALLGQVA